MASPAIRSNDIIPPPATTQTASAVAKPDIRTTDPITLSVLSGDIDDIVQHALHLWKNDAIAINNRTNTNESSPFINDEDFLLADLLQRSENDQQNIHLHSIGN